EMTLVFFNVHGNYVERTLPEGASRWVSGRVEIFQGFKQIVHPDFIVPPKKEEELPAFEPVYGLTAGLSGKILVQAVQQALARIPPLPEWIDPQALKRLALPQFSKALQTVHHPQSDLDIAPESLARRRLAYDEILAGQLALHLLRGRMSQHRGRAYRGDGRITRPIRDELKFALTGAQMRALEEIAADLAGETRMVRLLQGDVGSGKTIVALLAAAQVAEAGAQSAFMAPTEILARQHFATLRNFTGGSGLRIGLLTGREKGRERSEVLKALEAGDIDVLVGTHALFQTGVEFHDLGLAIVDEQHRFGVHQRLAITAKGQAVDFLVMTATPIPRTLLLTLYGDMSVSRLDEKPPGRTPVDTRAMPLERIGEIVDALERAIAAGARVYWICPLVEDSEEVEATAAEARASALRERFGTRVGLVHGRMKGREKDAVMAAFAAGGIDILVATTVVEVGVDVPEASIMVIENAERFGLSQLHQLRGRVGRGAARSSCLLLYRAPLGETAKQRLEVMRESDDGFRIAEEDLKLRGGGDLLGTRQSGMPGFMLVDAAHHLDLLQIARDDARHLLETDPHLLSTRGMAARTLLYLFARDEAAQLLVSG
ncbi:MAG: ATP-dependent DNA helicase RecG, partial [Flavobacteriaceae bacterium]